MAGFNQMLLAGNPWPIGAITHLLTKAQGNYELPKYTHNAGALDCTVLMELRQETVVVASFLSFSPSPICHVLLITQDSSTDREILSIKALPPLYKTQGFLYPCTLSRLLKIIALTLIC
jgi:hypothetical protein